MSRTRILRNSLATTFTTAESGEEEMVQRLSISLNAKHRKRALADRRHVIKALTLVGDLAPSGCDCSHCSRDWDCCGQFILDSTRMVPRPGGVVIVQRFSRNI